MGTRVVLITGALTGIGRAAALAFAREGNRIVVAGRHKPELGRDSPANRIEVANFVGGFEDSGAGLGVDFRMVVQRARDGRDGDVELFCNRSNR